MKFIASKINKFTPEDIKQIETEREYKINTDITIHLSDVEISSADIPGWASFKSGWTYSCFRCYYYRKLKRRRII